MSETSIVRLAHTCNTSQELGKAWTWHLEDYDVEPLFSQFGRETWELRDDLQKAAKIGDFTGHMITTFQLRSNAASLGFVRGAVEDGGCFMCYRKPFSSLRIQAVLNFAGSYLPDENIPAAVTSRGTRRRLVCQPLPEKHGKIAHATRRRLQWECSHRSLRCLVL